MGRLNHEPIRQARLPAAQSAAVDNTGVRYSDAVARTGLTDRSQLVLGGEARRCNLRAVCHSDFRGQCAFVEF